MVLSLDPEPVWDRPVDVPEKWIQNIDPSVEKELPGNYQVMRIFPYAASYWSRTAKIQTEKADGSSQAFFLKVAQKEIGKAMVSSEYVSMKTLHDTLPHFTPTPIAWGTYTADPNIHFYLCEFVELENHDLPDAHALASSLAELHKRTVSPNGKYGFPVQTIQGKIPQYTDWTDSWEDFFTKSLRLVMDNEERSQGPDPEVQRLCWETLDKVIPRLLRPLETGGRRIQPRLVHGDIWDGNVATSLETSMPIVFDATCIYGHNEIELAPLRPARHRMGKPYVEAYFEHFPISEPVEDQDDRNALYCLRWDMNCSTLYPGNLRYRKMCVDVMQRLIAKYPDGYEGWAKRKGEESISK